MRFYRIQKKVIHTGREETIAEAKYIGELRHKWRNYLQRWPLYWTLKVDHLTADTRGTIADSAVSLIVMDVIDIDWSKNV